MTAQERLSSVPEKPSASVVFVTPEMAERWLEANTRNRKLNERVVRTYARDMGSGAWLLTGEGVKFATDGSLLDGQHRLTAIVRAGITVPMFVMRGVSSEAQSVMDTGHKRTAADALTLLGEQNTSQLAATVRLALGVESGFADPGNFEPTHTEVQDFVSAHPEIRSAVQFIKPLVRRTDSPPSVAAYTYWVLSGIDTFEAANFWVAMAEKVGLKSGDPVIALSNRFAEVRRNRQTLSKSVYLSLVYRAWNARRKGQEMRMIRVNSASGGVVPIPKPL